MTNSPSRLPDIGLSPGRTRGGASARDVLVTGMGFCLPGRSRPVFTADDIWEIASRGASCLVHEDVYYGAVDLSPTMFDARLPDVPPTFSRHYTNAHRFGLISLVEACADAGLDFRAGDLTGAAVLTGRGGVDSNVGPYLAVLEADPLTTSPQEAMELFVRGQQGLTPSDVSLVQGALIRSTGPSFTVSCGCASSAVQVGTAQRLIAEGSVDLAVVSGVDLFGMDVILNVQRLLRSAQGAYESVRVPGMPELLPSFDRLMRPYDRRADCVNHGEGAATLVLESRSRADERGARAYGQVLAHAMTRDGLMNPLASDDSGVALVEAVRRCLGDRWDISQVPYIHGGSDGDVVVTAFEASAVEQLYGADSGVVMTSQEACFGHNGAPSGCVGVALSLLMMNRGEVCPTANCEEPAEGLPFDPVPGTSSRPLDFEYALTCNYQIGGVKSVILVGSPDAV